MIYCVKTVVHVGISKGNLFGVISCLDAIYFYFIFSATAIIYFAEVVEVEF
jgi:hypothetical protein